MRWRRRTVQDDGDQAAAVSLIVVASAILNGARLHVRPHPIATGSCVAANFRNVPTDIECSKQVKEAANRGRLLVRLPRVRTHFLS